MVTAEQIPRTNILELVINGAVTQEDYERTATLFLLLIKERGKIRVLKEVRHLGNVFPTAMGEEVGLFLPQLGKVERAALVADERWVEQMANDVAPAFPCPVRFFQPRQKAEAIAWLKAAN